MSQLNDIIQDLQWKLGERRREFTIGVSGLLVALLIGLLVWWAFFVRWQPPPSIFDSPVQDVLGYLAMDDFSQLPMEERIQFLIEFSDRFRGMEQSDSATMAAFLAGITGPVRETATQNIRVLAKDIMVDGAAMTGPATKGTPTRTPGVSTGPAIGVTTPGVPSSRCFLTTTAGVATAVESEARLSAGTGGIDPRCFCAWDWCGVCVLLNCTLLLLNLKPTLI